MASKPRPLAIMGTRRAARELVDGTIRVQIDIEPKYRKDFHEVLGDIDMLVAIAPLDSRQIGINGPKIDPATELASDKVDDRGEMDYKESEIRWRRSLAQQLHISGYFRSPKLWRALHEVGIYSLATHKHWIEEQPCVLRSAECAGDVVLHHCAGAAIPAAGPDLQPDHPQKVPHWYGVPLCHKHHLGWAHGSAEREDKENLRVIAVRMIADQAKGAMKQYLGLATLADLTEEQLADFEARIGLRWNPWREPS